MLSKSRLNLAGSIGCPKYYAGGFKTFIIH